MPSRACASQLRRSERGLAVVRRRASTVVAFGLLVGPLFTRVALADEPTDPATATPVESPIEEIVVTARRDEEPMQSVPVAVSAFTSADLTRAAPHTLLDLDGLSPNVFIGKNPAGPAAGAIFIRGIGYADIEKTQSPQVGVIVDGVFQGTNTGQLIDLFDVEQLEIDRGPQGVLYGKNTMGGMIVVRRVEPLFDEWHVALSVAGGSRAMGRFKGRLNVPLIEDKLALKVAAVSMQQRGDTWNRTLQRSVGGTDYQTYTAALAWKPTERARALLTYDHIADHSGSTAFDALYDGAQPFETLADYAGFMRYDLDSVGLQASWDGALGTLSSVTAYVDSRDDVGQDFDGSSSAISYAAPIDQLHTLRQQHFQQFTEEARLSGNLGERVAYMVGGFFYDTTLNFYQGTNGGFQFANPLFPSQTCDQIGFRSNPSFGNLCQTPNSASSSIVREAVRSSAVFGELRWRPFDSFELAVGLRYISERRSFSSSDFESRVPPGSIEPPRRVLIVGGPPPGFPVASRQRWARTLAKITATWTVSDRSHVYASYAGGFRSGGFSLRGLDEETLSFGPESANAYEIGSKSDLWGRRWRLNLAAFLTQQKGAQFLTFVPLPDGGVDNIINNANESRIYGLEAESALVVTPEFRLIASLGVQNASSDPIRISSRRAPFPENDGTPQQGQACNPIANPSYFPNAPSTKGNTCPDVTLPASTLFRFPHYNWSLTGVLTRGFGDDALEASVSWKGMGRFALDSIAGREIDQPSYSTLDFNLSYAWKLRNGDALRLAFVGKNVLSKKYLGLHLYLAGDASNGTGYSGFQSWGPPRTLEIELSYEH